MSCMTTSWIMYCDETTNVTRWPYLSVWVKCPFLSESAWPICNPDIISYSLLCSCLTHYIIKQALFCIACYFWMMNLLPEPNSARSNISDLIYSATSLTSHSWSRSVSHWSRCSVDQQIIGELNALCQTDLNCTDSVNENRPIETAFRLARCLTCAHTYTGTHQLEVGWVKTQLEIWAGNQQQMWV